MPSMRDPPILRRAFSQFDDWVFDLVNWFRAASSWSAKKALRALTIFRLLIFTFKVVVELRRLVNPFPGSMSLSFDF